MLRPTFRPAERTRAREDFVHDLATGRFGGARWAAFALFLGAGAGYAWNRFGAIEGALAILVIGGGFAFWSFRLDRDRWRAQDVFLWQRIGRARRWRADTGGDSPGIEPGRADAWLATHPRGSVPQVYRVLAASAADDPIQHQRELDALQPLTPEEEAWKAYATIAPRIEWGTEADLEPVKLNVERLPAGEDRAQLRSAVAIAESIVRHDRREQLWLTPMVEQWDTAPRERLTRRQRVRLWLARLAVLPAFLLPAVLLAATGLGAPEPYPAAYRSTSFEVRGDVGDVDTGRLLLALPAVAADVAGTTPASREPLSFPEWSQVIDDGMPTLIWHVDAIDLAAPPGITCEKVTAVEVLLGRSDVPGGSAIVTCGPGTARLFLVPVDAGTIDSVRVAVGLPSAR